MKYIVGRIKNFFIKIRYKDNEQDKKQLALLSKANIIEEKLDIIKEEIARLGRIQARARHLAESEYKSLFEAISSISNDSLIEVIIDDLLVIADGLDAGIKAGEKIFDYEISSWIEGLKIVRHRVSELLEKIGIHPVNSIGTYFDPEIHKAVAVNTDPNYDDSIILDEYKCGYTRNGKIIRHAEVIVNKINNSFELKNDFID